MAGFTKFQSFLEQISVQQKYTAHETSSHAAVCASLNQFFSEPSGYLVSGKEDENEDKQLSDDSQSAIEEMSKKKSEKDKGMFHDSIVQDENVCLGLGSGSQLNVERPVLHGTVPLFYQHEKKMAMPSNLIPVAISEARVILSEYIQAVSAGQVDEKERVTVLCDGALPTNTVALSAFVNCGQIDFDEVIFTGHVSANEWSLKKLYDELCEAASYRVHHTTPLQVCSKAYAKYDILNLDDNQQTGDDTLLSSVSEDEKSSCRLSVEWVWKDVSSILCEPSVDSLCAINVKVVPGDYRSPLAHIYQELLAVKVFLQACADPNNWGESEQDGLKSALDVVQELAQETQSIADGGERNGAENGLPNQGISPVAYLIMPERLDMDYTERLWKAIKDVKSLSYLKSLYSAVFTGIVQGLFQPYISQHNKTSTATILRECLSLRGQVDEGGTTASKLRSWFTVKNILTSCVEIGINKLKRDYEAFFLGEELTTFHHLRYFIDDSTSVQEQFSKLESLHCAMEVISVVKLYMAPPIDFQRAFLRPVLSYYEEHPASSSPVFSMPVVSVPPQLRTLCLRLQPSTWVVSFESQNTDIQHLHVFSTKQLFQASSSDIDDASTSSSSMRYDAGSSSSYFYYVARHHTVAFE
ncbi:protein zwilch homolog isoform X2 [Corticium candelabrum]|uniref:protein zwilch homolog isoform X2 n=1 Tax=Corticium candelabrum TaxID=121492 RepID=UPI002E27262A|nr:protein zwilch homolog isoform X2 [Corticium candelabrum]